MTWMVFFSSLRPFGPRLETAMLRAGFVYSGVGPDYRVLVKKARKQAQAYFLQYRALKPVTALRASE